MLLLRLVRENTDRPVASFSFRSQAPLYDLSPFRLVGVASNGRIELQAEGPDAKVAMTAIADLA
jgi:3-methylfumaryl-CoA hydratase